MSRKSGDFVHCRFLTVEGYFFFLILPSGFGCEKKMFSDFMSSSKFILHPPSAFFKQFYYSKPRKRVIFRFTIIFEIITNTTAVSNHYLENK